MIKKELEAIYFYTANDYLIINNMLLNNLQDLERLFEVVNKDYKGMLEEMKENPAKRLGLDDIDLANDIFNCYKKRYQESIDMKKVISQANIDIENINKLFTNSSEEITLHRNIKSKHLSDFKSGVYDYKAFSSWLTHPTDIIYSYGPKDKYVELVLKVNKGFPIIKIDDLPKFVQNEKGEIILPPFKSKIVSVENSKKENCEAVVNLKLEN